MLLIVVFLEVDNFILSIRFMLNGGINILYKN